MDFEDALRAAEGLAEENAVVLGDCLFEDRVDDKGHWWAFSFAIVDGPADWQWVVIVNDEGSENAFYATQGTPHSSLRPKIRRRWFFGPRYARRL